MNTETSFEFVSNNIEDTLQFAEKIGRNLKGGETIELRSDIGGGKTTLVHGLAKGAGSTDQVASPTFTISRVYSCAEDKRIQHYDFYRLDDPGLMQAELHESIHDPTCVTVVEWAGVVNDVLPEDRLLIEIRSTGDDSRIIAIQAGQEHARLLEGVR